MKEQIQRQAGNNLQFIVGRIHKFFIGKFRYFITIAQLVAIGVPDSNELSGLAMLRTEITYV